jgi:transposase
MPSSIVYRSLHRTRKYLEKEVKAIEEKLLSLLNDDQQKQFTSLKSIPRIREKTALFFIVITDGFLKFENASQLCSYAGITTVTRESGSSVRVRVHISKIGNRKLRNLLFLYSFNACKLNKAFREVCERIMSKRKSKKLAHSSSSALRLHNQAGLMTWSTCWL